MSPSFLFKIATVGGQSVGKTSMILRYVTGRFREYYAPTLGADFSIKQMKIGFNQVKLQIWDLGSQDFLGDVRAGFYPGSRGVVFLYDVTRESTLDALTEWKREVDSHLKDYKSVVVANKIDLEDERVISMEEGVEKAKKMGADYIETSVKLDQNISDAFLLMATRLLEEFG